jgi:hypothetical protein
MRHKLVKLLAITPIAVVFLAQIPTKVQAENVSCFKLLYNKNEGFRAHAIYPQDANLYSGNLTIRTINKSRWTGVIDSREDVNGTISGSEMTLRRAEGQTWYAKCTKNGISGNFKKDGLSALGAFVLIPNR